MAGSRLKLIHFAAILCLWLINAAIGFRLHAQINFGKPSSETAMLQDSVNSCAEKQTRTICLNALAHIRLMRAKSKTSPQTADSIMLDAVELVPLYVLARLYELDNDYAQGCAFARMGQTHTANIVSDAARLTAEDPEAFRNLDQSLSELAMLGDNFTDILVGCAE